MSNYLKQIFFVDQMIFFRISHNYLIIKYESLIIFKDKLAPVTHKDQTFPKWAKLAVVALMKEYFLNAVVTAVVTQKRLNISYMRLAGFCYP